MYEQIIMETTEDTIIETFGMEIHGKRATANFRVRQVLRRYVKEDRVLFAWRQTIEPFEFASQPASGICFLEQGYIVIKRPTTASQDYSLMQTCFLLNPDRYDSDPDYESMIGQLSNFFMDSLGRNIYFSHQMIENSLLDQLLAPSS